MGYWGFKLDERVRVRTKNLDETGTIGAISRNPDVGLGSDLYPSYLVDLDDDTWGWFKGVSLTTIIDPKAHPVKALIQSLFSPS